MEEINFEKHACIAINIWLTNQNLHPLSLNFSDYFYLCHPGKTKFFNNIIKNAKSYTHAHTQKVDQNSLVTV